ncbi:hypothetical protein IFM89_007408 [Coptis chinensis]|uniref:acetate--CoA ligase n=1 Tax=Coptis chinensis TaxID=261450 RepID=A0A835IKS0_9MAGN|nr:hypothetical protein IFM89_007408 [Coptis chinensis]
MEFYSLKVIPGSCCLVLSEVVTLLMHQALKLLLFQERLCVIVDLLFMVVVDAVPKYPMTCDVEWVDAEDPLFLLCTSGSTGKPKGVLHTTGGYMVYNVTTFKYAFDYKPSDVYWCTADCGWITGHSYVTYGPLLNGASVIVFEGSLQYIFFQLVLWSVNLNVVFTLVKDMGDFEDTPFGTLEFGWESLFELV